VSVQGKFELGAWQGKVTSQAKITYLFDAYWDAMMNRELIIDPNKRKSDILSKSYGKRRLPSHLAVRRTLIFAAKVLAQDSQIELSIEAMQPSACLTTPSQKRLYQIIVHLFFGISNGLVWWQFLGFMGGVGALAGSLISNNYLMNISSKNFTDNYNIRDFFTGMAVLFLSLSAAKIFFMTIFGALIGIFFGNLEKWIFQSFQLGVVLGSGLLCIGIMFCTFVGLILTFQYVLKRLSGGHKNKVNLNQTISSSVATFVLLFSLGLLLGYIGLRFFNLPQLFVKIKFADVQLFLFGAVLSTFFGGVVLGMFNGDTGIQHIALRLVLWKSGYAPPRYDRLLDYCTERLLLQRIGGRYRFMHKLLQDHFAAMDLD
jgi:hypothetical protein